MNYLTPPTLSTGDEQLESTSGNMIRGSEKSSRVLQHEKLHARRVLRRA
jgi:hypothetical protein